MRDPFRIEGPAAVSFSGGRTSGYMLWRIIQAHGGALPPDVVPAFANTGKEMPETLAFVRDCEQRWRVPIVWLEFRPGKQFERVNFESASREGEPYEALIRERNYLPNPVTRFCTTELKIRTMHRYLRSLGWTEWDQCVGIRADEQRRVAKMRARGESTEGAFETMVLPLAEAGITRHDVAAYWRQSPFDLRLPNRDGTTPLGNCDLCFLKGTTRITSIIRERPHLATWWARMEQTMPANSPGAKFHKDRPSYAEMAAQGRDQRTIFQDEPLGDCYCGE